jgi:PAS domain S-box-containing protein
MADHERGTQRLQKSRLVYASLVLLATSAIVCLAGVLIDGPVEERIALAGGIGAGGILIGLAGMARRPRRQAGRGRIPAEAPERPIEEGTAASRAALEEPEPNEETLRENQKIFRSAFDHAAIGRAISRADGPFLKVNRAFCEITGYSANELIGNSWQDFVHPDSLGEAAAGIGQLVQGEIPVFRGELKASHREGHPYWADVNVVLVKDSRGDPLYLVGDIEDITERRRERAELTARARQQAVVAELGQRALAATNLQELMEDAVDTLARTLEVEYSKVLELLPGGDAMLLRAGTGWRDGLVGSAGVGTGEDSQAGYTLSSSAPVIVEDLAQEIRFRGPPLLIDHGVVSGMSVIIAGKERPYGVLGVHTKVLRKFTKDDVHFMQAVANVLAEALRRKRAEDAIIERETRLKAVLASALDPMITIDSRGIVQTASDSVERVFGWKPEELAGQNVKVLMPEPYRARHEQGLEKYQETGQSGVQGTTSAFEGLHRDGSTFPCEISVSRADLPGHPGPLFTGVIRDITERKRAAEALVQSEEKFRTIFENAPMMIDSFDDDGRCLLWNKECERTLGVTREEMMASDDPLAFFYPDRAVRDEVVARINRAEGTFHEYEFFARDGSLRTQLWADFRLPSGVLISTGLDITERKRAEKALAESEERMNLALSSSGVGTWSWNLIENTSLRGGSMRDLWGLREGDPCPETLEDFMRTLHPDDRDRVGGEIARSVEEDAPYATKCRVIWPDGSVHIIASRGRVYRDGQGRALQMTGVCWDVTDRELALEALKISEARFRRLIENLPEGVVVHSGGRILYANLAAAAGLGYQRPSQLIGKSVLDCVLPDERTQSMERVRTLQERGRPVPPREMRIRRSDGEVRIVEMQALPVEFEGEAAILHIARDVTKRSQMQARLLQADRMASVGTLAAGIAHEINNPLSYVIANLDFASEELGRANKEAASQGPRAEGSPLPAGEAAEGGASLDEIEEVVREAREGAERVRVIVRDLKTFSRADEDRRSHLDVREVLDFSIKIVASEIHRRSSLVKEYLEVPPVHANHSRLAQVFLNLLVNAVQALPEGQAERNEIRVATGVEEDGRVFAEVTDTGAGIEPRNVSRIFDPFFTTKPMGVGTGLGLSISQSIVTGLGGEVSVKSRVGEGTTFRVSLPSSESRNETPAPSAPPSQR